MTLRSRLFEASSKASKEAADALLEKETSAWTSFGASEVKARDAMVSEVSKQRDLHAGEANLHENAATAAKEAREAASKASADTQSAALSNQTSQVTGMRTALESFTTESAAEPDGRAAPQPAAVHGSLRRDAGGGGDALALRGEWRYAD